jgi:hypothetical protein
MSVERAEARRVTSTRRGARGKVEMVGRGGTEGERGTEPGQEIDFPGLAGNGDTRSPIVSPR